MAIVWSVSSKGHVIACGKRYREFVVGFVFSLVLAINFACWVRSCGKYTVAYLYYNALYRGLLAAQQLGREPVGALVRIPGRAK